MAYTGTYEQELRKNPTDYKLRAMGKRKYELRRREDGKVTISTKNEPTTREAFGVGKKREIDSNKKKKEKTLLSSRAKENLKEEMEKIRQGESKQREVKTSKDDVRATDNKDKRTRKIELQNKKSDVPKPQDKDKFSMSEIITTGAGGTLVVGIAGDIARRVYKGRKARKFAEARTKKNLKNLQQTNPKRYQEIMKKIMKGLSETAKGNKNIPKKEVKKDTTKKKKNIFQRTKERILQAIKKKTTSSTGSRTGTPTGLGVGGTPFGDKGFDGRKKKTIY